MQQQSASELYKESTLQSLQGCRRSSEALFIRSRPSRRTDAYASALWRIDVATRPGAPQRLTMKGFDAHSPRLSPDGSKVAFLSERNNGAQIHLLDLAGGEAQPLASIDARIKTIEGWSADGKQLLVIASVAWAEDDSDDIELGEGERPLVVRHLPYKVDGMGATVGRRSHLYAVDAATGDVKPLTAGDFDVKEGCWSPDGRHLAYVRNRSANQRHVTDLWLTDAMAGSHRRVTDLAAVLGASWSPTGRHIVFGGSRDAGDSLDQPWLLDVESGSVEPIGDGVHLQGDTFVWDENGSRIATVVALRGMQEIAIIHLPDRRIEHFPRRLRHVINLVHCKGRLVFSAATMRAPEEIYSCTWDGKDECRHTSFNRRAARRHRSRVSVRSFDVPDGQGGREKIDAWILKPAGPGPFPVLLDMHGGPHSAVLIDHAEHVYWYALLSRGWMIVAPNAVGSAGYGDAFARRLIGQWGALDLPQYLAIVSRLQEEQLADHRVACAGKSYGGFLAAWAVGHSEVIRAAIVSAPVSNVESHAGTSDTGFYVTPYAMGGEIEEKRDRYHRLSPVEYCHRTKASVLLLQGGDDARCPVGQAEELFSRIVRCSEADAEMVIYPGASHGLAGSGKPSHRVHYHQRIVDWLEQTTARKPDADENTRAASTVTGRAAHFSTQPIFEEMQ